MKWLDIIQSVGIILSIVLVIWQVRVQIKQMKATANALIYSKVDETNRLMFEHPDVFPKLNEPYPGGDLPESGDRRYHLMHIFFTTFEQVFFYQKTHKFLEQSDWNSWTRVMSEILQKPYARGHWGDIKSQYSMDFQKFIDELPRELITAKRSLPRESSIPTVSSVEREAKDRDVR